MLLFLYICHPTLLFITRLSFMNGLLETPTSLMNKVMFGFYRATEVFGRASVVNVTSTEEFFTRNNLKPKSEPRVNPSRIGHCHQPCPQQRVHILNQLNLIMLPAIGYQLWKLHFYTRQLQN